MTAYDITCPHCGATFYNQVIQSHGAIRCGRCNKPFNI